MTSFMAAYFAELDVHNPGDVGVSLPLEGRGRGGGIGRARAYAIARKYQRYFM
jgi:hypothetical protein